MTVIPISSADPQRKYSIFPSKNYKYIGSCKQNEKSEISFTPSEYKLGESRVTLGDTYSRAVFLGHKLLVSEEAVKEDKGEWIDHLFKGEKTYQELMEKIKALGFTDEEAKELLDEVIYHSERACDWANANENYGGLSASSMATSALLGTLKICLDKTDLVPSSVKNTIGLLHGGTAALRGYLQYGYVYGRFDDEKGANNYQGEYYGNKTSSIFGDFAHLFETKVNPVSLPLLELTSKKTQGILTPVLILSNILWWRIRMLGEIRQDFGTDLFSYLFNKPLALLKINESINKVNEIKEKGHLNYPYIQKRLVELIGLDPGKHKLKDIFPELAKLLKVTFGKDKVLAKEASHNIGKFFAPIFGFYGFAAFAIGIPLRSILKWLDIESKYINALAQSSMASQQLLYLFRLMLPEQFENQMHGYSKTKDEINKLKDQRNHLFYTGVANCLMSSVSTLLKLFNLNENSYLKFGSEIIDEIVDKGIGYYFSRRRELKGKKHRLDNPDLFNIDGTAKIISDKVKIEDEKEMAVKAA